MTFTVALIAGFGLLILLIVSVYNGLVRSRNYVKNAYAQIDVQLNRRYDLIPNLVESAKGYMKHEKETLEAVINARNQALKVNSSVASDPSNPDNMKKLIAAEGLLSRSMGSFMALAERYPDLKANTTISQLMEELTSTENKIAFARQGFNDTVTAYNNKREVFPNNIIAGTFGFQAAQVLEVENPKKREAVKVQF